MKKRIFKIFVSIMILITVTGCVVTPSYYGGGYGGMYAGGGYVGGGGVMPAQPGVYGFHNQPVMFAGPAYGGAFYDPFFVFWDSIARGVVTGLSALFIFNAFGGGHHHHHH